jgi:probable phosphoglycerate mutase
VREAATGEVLVEIGEGIGVATNNVAEYSGLVAGLTAAADLGAVEVEVRMDSRLVVEQMSGRWQIRNPGLRPLAAKAAALVTKFESVRFTWVPREQNVTADALANAAMDRRAAPPSATVRAAAPALAPPPSWAPRHMDDAARILLVRHGQTTFTMQRRYSGRGDVELTAQGEAQTEALATRVAALVMADGRAPLVVSSPLKRCLRAAELVAERLGGVGVRVDEAFVECDFGEWEGLTHVQVREHWSTQLDAWLGSAGLAPPGGESFADVAARVRPAVARLAAEYAGHPVVVCSHVTPIKLVLRDALAATDALLHRLYLDPGGISVIDFWPDGGVAVRTVNETAHLA